MASLGSMTAAPRTLRTKGAEIRLRPLRMGDWGEYEAWMQDQFCKIASAAMRPDDPPDTRATIRAAIYQIARTIRVGSKTGRAIAAHPAATAKIVELAIRRDDPVADPFEILADPDDLDSAVMLLNETMPPDQPAKPDRSAGPPDYASAFANLADAYQWTPEQIAEMTPAQIAGLSKPAADRKPGRRTIPCSTLEEARAILAKIRTGQPL
jgi:hypothetical protein